MEEQLYRQFFEIENTHWWFVARRAILLTYLRHRLGTGQRLSLLDVGCGTGAILADAARLFDAYGVDSSPTAIEYCRKRGVTNLFVGTIREYPATGTFDVILLLDVIEHIEDDLSVLRDAYARLNDGGHVLITVPAYQWLWGAHDVVNHHKRRYTGARLKAVVNSTGFHIEHLTYFNTLLFPLAVLRRMFARGTHAQEADDFRIPPRTINATLQAIFRLEEHLVPYARLPFGLSVLCWATKHRT